MPHACNNLTNTVGWAMMVPSRAQLLFLQVF